jgi:hypothetical protein
MARTENTFVAYAAIRANRVENAVPMLLFTGHYVATGLNATTCLQKKTDCRKLERSCRSSGHANLGKESLSKYLIQTIENFYRRIKGYTEFK